MPLAKIGTIPGYTKAVATYKPSAATIKAVAPTQLQKNALGPKFGGNYAAGNQAIPSYLLPAPKLPPSTVPSNYQPNIDEILGAPLSEQARGSYNTNLQSLMNALRSNLGGAVIKSGYDPTAAFQKLMAERPDLGDYAGLLDNVDLAAASANPTSDRAMAQQAYERGQDRQTYALAARGMGTSGAFATGTNALGEARTNAENQSRDALMAAIQSGITGNLSDKATGYKSLLDTYGQVAQQLAAQPGGKLPQGTADQTDVENAAAVGHPYVPGAGTVPSAGAAPVNYVNWGGQQIANVNQMRQWLGARGQRWDVWRLQHPALARQLIDLS